MNPLTDVLWWHFSVSGVETWVWLPPRVALVASFFSSMVGISGAFLLMPFQTSVLGYVAPSVSATNLVFNLYAPPGGVWRFALFGGTPGTSAGQAIDPRPPGPRIRCHHLDHARAGLHGQHSARKIRPKVERIAVRNPRMDRESLIRASRPGY